MSKKIIAYDMIISCPSDVEQYIDILEREIERFNNFFGRFHDIVIRTRRWSNDAFPEFGNHPQELLNKQIVDSSDMALALFWTRFGTPTDAYGSGTEEEIQRMVSNKKQVFLYFLDSPIPPSKLDKEQYSKIQEFKDKHRKDGLWFPVSDEQDLLTKFKGHLELYFYSLIKGTEFKKRNNKKEILWVDDKPENNVYERKLLERYGLNFTLALSTNQALHFMKHDNFALVISDMGRKEGNNEGYVLLDAIRETNNEIPFILYTYSVKQEHIDETLRRRGQGHTGDPKELIDLVITNLLKA